MIDHLFVDECLRAAAYGWMTVCAPVREFHSCASQRLMIAIPLFDLPPNDFQRFIHIAGRADKEPKELN
jgi:hypothetical protein